MGSTRRSLGALGVLLAMSGVLAACLSHMTSMPGTSFAGSPLPLDDEASALTRQLSMDIEALASDIGRRSLTDDPQALERAATFIRGRLTELGYAVSDEPFQVGAHTVRNLVAERRGATRPNELIVVGAHYDSAPGTPGADDNGSGVAVALALAENLAHASPARTVRFVFFTNEEPPWFKTEDMGSEVYARAARARNDDVRAMVALETLGYFTDAPNSQHYPWPFSVAYPSTGHFVAFVGNTESRALVRECVRVFRAHAAIASEGAAVPDFIEGVDWSDHGPFWRQGYPAFMVTDTAPFRNPHYHEATDVPAHLDLPRLARVAQGLTHVVRELAERETLPQG